MDSNPMGGMPGDNNSFLRDPGQQQQQQQPQYGGQAYQVPPQQQQQQQQQLKPSVFTYNSPMNQQQPQQQQGGNMYNNQYRPQPQQQPQQQQSMMKSSPQQYQQQQQQASPYNFNPPPQPTPSSAGMGFAQRSAMMQQQQQQPPSGGGGAYGNVQQQQQQTQSPAPPVPQIIVPQPSSNTYGGGRAPAAPAPGSYAQRYQAMQQQNQQQPAAGPTGNTGNIYSSVAAGSDNLYPPSPQRQSVQQQQSGGSMQQQQQQQQPAPAPGSFAQRQAAMMGQGQNQKPVAAAPGSFAQRQAAMMGQTPTQQGGGMIGQQQQQQQFQQPGQPQPQFPQPGQQQQQQQFQQPGQQPPQQQFQQPGQPMPPQPPQRPMLVDPPEVVAQQQRLLTDATRKVQEHAYYMKQAIDRHDLPVVLERAACMVGELGEHAHSHNSHKLHPPAPGATGTSTALQPKNYYELHLRALEELPTLENYLLDVATASKQQGQIQQQQQPPPPQQQQQQQLPPQQQPEMGGVPAPVPSGANSAALMQQLTGDPSGGNFVNPPQPNNNNMAMNPNNPLGGGPGVYSNVMGGNGNMMNNNSMMANSQMGMGMNNNSMMANSQMGMGMGMPNNGMMTPQQQPMMNSSVIAPPSPPITYTMMELYDCVQYCPNVLSRLYLQICAASALIRSGEVGARWVFKDLIEAVKCVQNPVRGLFLRHYLLQAFRDKLPDVGIPVDEIGSIIRGTSQVPASPTGENTVPAENASTPAKLSDSVADISEKGTVKDAYEFVLANFIEMNKLWVRIQHLPGDQRTKAVRRRREKDRNELRILVGTNLVRLSALDSVTSTIYGQVILPTVLDQIVICADPLSQAYLLDCIVQVFPDEYHIETMPILLAVCPKLRDKVNIRTILHSLMTRLANYLADEELLDEKDSNQVKRAVALDSFRMFDECVQKVYNARGPKLNAKEVIRLQTALLEYSMKCYKGNREHIVLCLKNCVEALQRARDNAAYMMPPPQPPQQYGQPQMPPPPPPTALEPVATKELEKLLSIPLEELALGVLTLDHYSDLITFLPWSNRRELSLNMLESVIKTGKSPESVKEVEEIFSVIAPLLRGENDETPSSSNAEVDRTANLMAGLGISPDQQQFNAYAPQQQQQQGFNGGGVDPIQFQQDSAQISKLLGMLDNPDTDVLFEMLSVARKHMSAVKSASPAHAALVFNSLKLARRVFREAHEESPPSAAAVEEAENTSEEKAEAEAAAEDPETSTEKDGEEEAAETKVETVEEEDGKTEEVPEEKAEAVEKPAANEDEAPSQPKVVTCRKVFVFVLETIGSFAQYSPERGIKLYLEAALTADKLGAGCESDDEKVTYGNIANELLSLAFALYEQQAAKDILAQRPCIISMIGTLMACRSLAKPDYEGSIAKISKFAAKATRQPDQCELVTRCSHLFYVLDDDGKTVVYANPQRSLECLQRSLKLANACTTADVSNLKLFVDLLDIYLYFFEKNNPHITGNYITGLAALIKEHSNGVPPHMQAAAEAKKQFLQIVRYIKKMKVSPESAEKFQAIDVSAIET